MADTLFVSPEYLKAVTSMSNSVTDDRMIPAIILAQDKYIQIYLGSRLIKRLKDDIANDTLAGEYEHLMDEYIRKATSWWTYMELLPTLFVQVENGGLVQRISDDVQVATPEDFHREVERARQNAQFYTYRMYKYIITHTSEFPEYNQASKEEILSTPADYIQSGLTISRSISRQSTRSLYDIRYLFRVP